MEKGFVDCYSCDRRLVMVPEQRTYYYKNDVTAAFRCYECGRIFCGECATEHFGMEDEKEST